MTAETPRTDASKRVHSRYHDPRTPHFPRETYCVDYDDAVRLERDLTAARARVAELEAIATMLDAVVQGAQEEFVRVPYGASHEDVAAINDWHKMAREARALLSPSPEPQP